MSNKKSKNVSKTVRNGTILRTRDEYFKGDKNYRKPGYEKAGHYRAAAVVDTNRDDELALVKLTKDIGEVRVPCIYQNAGR